MIPNLRTYRQAETLSDPGGGLMLLSADRLPPPGRRAEPFGGGFDQAIVIQTFLALLVLVFSCSFFYYPV